METLLLVLLLLTALFLILLVLVQRGRGGGLAGALGGAGGQSAFGAKAGDLFTRITIVTACGWILLCVLSVKLIGGIAETGPGLGKGKPTPGGAVSAAPEEDGDQKPSSSPAPESPAPKSPAPKSPAKEE